MGFNYNLGCTQEWDIGVELSLYPRLVPSLLFAFIALAIEALFYVSVTGSVCCFGFWSLALSATTL